MNKKEAIAYAQITLDYIQSSKYKGEVNPTTLGIEMKQAFSLYPHDLVVDIAKSQIEASKKLLSFKKECDFDE